MSEECAKVAISACCNAPTESRGGGFHSCSACCGEVDAPTESKPVLPSSWEPTDQMRSIVDEHHNDTDGLLRALHSAGLLALDSGSSTP